ncbi:MAG: V-type ATP synthase subunit F [bacterium]|nr:V-type ATP synthase subunit F [bacterium]
MKYYSIGDEDTVLGFSLVGVEGRIVRTKDEAEETVQKVFARNDIGILLITERIAALIKATIDQLIFTSKFPLIIEIPDRKGPLADRKSIEEIIRSSIGIKI